MNDTKEELKLTKEELKAGMNDTKEELKAGMTETKEELQKMKQDKRPEVSKSYTELGGIAMKSLNSAKLLNKFEGYEGLPSIMTEDNIHAMTFLKNESESNCYVQCKLIPVFDEIGLVVVNSELSGFEWLQTFSDNKSVNKRPDFLLCNICFYEARSQPVVGSEVIAIMNTLLRNDEKLLHGVKAGHPLEFLNNIHIIEGKFEDICTADWGQVNTYAGLQARTVTNPAFHRLILFDREKFILFLSKGGEFVSATECRWSTPGSKKLMQEFFNVPSLLVKALKESCQALSVTPCIPQINLPCILGTGGSGVVFRVTPFDADLNSKCGSTRSVTTALRNKALKVVVGGKEAVSHMVKEWEIAKYARTLCDRIVTVGAMYSGSDFAAYLMDEVGTAVETSTAEQKKALFAALFSLHICGVVHGDPRVQNAILTPNGIIMWIDFYDTYLFKEESARIADDFCMLFKSVFRQAPKAEQIELYEQCVRSGNILAETWETLFEL
jgi:hypothetical protein